MDSVEPSKPPSGAHNLRISSAAARRRRVEIRKFRVIANTNGFLEPALKKPRSSSSSSSSSTTTTTTTSTTTTSATSATTATSVTSAQTFDTSIAFTPKAMDPHILNSWHCDGKVATRKSNSINNNNSSSPSSEDGLSDRSSGTTSSSSVVTEVRPEVTTTTTAGGEGDRSVEVAGDVNPGVMVMVTSSTSGNSGSRSPGCVAADTCPPHGAVYICGRRREMEDAVAVVPSFMSVPCGTVGGCDCNSSSLSFDHLSALHFFGVYDGHGGSQVAAFCKEHLHRALEEEFNTVKPSVTDGELVAGLKQAMVTTFLKVDAQVGGFGGGGGKGEDSPSSSTFVAPETVGSTAVVAVVGSNRILVANCGDSRAVLSRGGRAIPLSYDHKPDRDDELARVEAAGGRVIFWNGYRVLGVLAMSRAIGDRYLKPFIIPEPDVTCIERSEEDDCLILASDGLWDVVSNETVCEIARKCLAGRHRSAAREGRRESNADLAAGLLTKFAIAKGSADNISVVVVDLRAKRT